jgi:protein-disulfide isomerase
MASGRQSKRKRREARVPPPPVRGGERRASRRVLVVAGAVVAMLVAVGVVAAIVLRGNSSSANVPQRGSLVNALPGAGIPQNGNVLGSPSAPVTMIEYVDLQCPYCGAFETQSMPTLISRYVRTGKLKVDARIIGFIGPDSVRGRAAAIAAGRQDKLFNFAQLLYFNQGAENTGWLSDSMVQSAAASIPGLDVPKLLDERSSSAVSDEARRFDTQASDDKVRATPTILVGKTGRTPKQVTLTSPSNPAPIVTAIQNALAS